MVALLTIALQIQSSRKKPKRKSRALRALLTEISA